MRFSRALRLLPPTASQVGVVGSGGKTTALFLLARQLLKPITNHQLSSLRSLNTEHWKPTNHCIVTAASHLAASQTSLADHHLIASSSDELSGLLLPASIPPPGLTLVTGPLEGNRAAPIPPAFLSWLHDTCKKRGIPLLIEADGSRQLPLKAPANHEPPIPDFVETVIVLAGLSGLGQPLDEAHVHRPQIFSALSRLPLGATITPESLVRVLSHPQGGLKNIPARARRVLLLNQADTPEVRSIGGRMARDLLGSFDSVLVGSLHQDDFQTIERCAGIILAAGESKRFGVSKPLLDWRGKPFVRHTAETALRADLDPVIVVTGFDAERVASALSDLPVQIVHNLDYRQGQSASIRAGLSPLSLSGRGAGGEVGAALFLLADQPQIPVEVIRALVETHSQSLPAVLAPLVLEEKRANPVLFDRVTFADLLSLTGDVGGRAIFDKHKVEYLPWHDDLLLFDVDTPEDYERLTRLD